MLPKIIHFCWVGPKTFPKKYSKYLHSWKKVLFDWRIRFWGNEDIDLTLPFLQRANNLGLWGQVSDYLRWKALYEEGGIYFDTDIEVVRPLPAGIRETPFLGFENVQNKIRKNPIGTAVIGLNKCHPLALQMMKFYHKYPNKTILNTDLVTEDFKKKGLKKYGIKTDEFDFVTIEGIRLYHCDLFYPNLARNPEWALRPPSRTFTIHHSEGSWAGAKIDPLPVLRRFFDLRIDRKIIRPIEKAAKLFIGQKKHF